MKQVLSFFLALVLLVSIGCSGSDLQPQSKEQLVREYINNTYMPAVALIYASPSQGKKIFGCTATAFQEVDEGYLFISAAHCVIGTPGDIFLSPDTSNPEIYYPAKVLAYGDLNSDVDYSVLYIKAPHGAFKMIRFGHNPTQPGEAIFSVSAPDGVGKALLRGVIAILSLPHHEVVNIQAYRDDWKGDILMELPGEYPGSSGSTIICEDQMAVCGIIAGHMPGGSVAQPIEKFEVWWLLVKSGRLPPFPPPPPLASSRDITNVLISNTIAGKKQ